MRERERKREIRTKKRTIIRDRENEQNNNRLPQGRKKLDNSNIIFKIYPILSKLVTLVITSTIIVYIYLTHSFGNFK